MTLSLAGYTVGANQPLNRARILWSSLTGIYTSSAGGMPDWAATDFTSQRWMPTDFVGSRSWNVEYPVDSLVDMVILAAHNLSTASTQVNLQYSTTTGGAFVGIGGTIVPTDNSAIAWLISDGSGNPLTIRRLRIVLTNPTGAQVGIVRSGVALQMQRPVYGDHAPLGLSRKKELAAPISETGAWLGRKVQKVSLEAPINWTRLEAAWYRANFEPFAKVLPDQPFGLIMNPSEMPESVAWCWTDSDPAPMNKGGRDLMTVSLNITGFAG